MYLDLEDHDFLSLLSLSRNQLARGGCMEVFVRNGQNILSMGIYTQVRSGLGFAR